jgi:hypothetical protein
MCFVLSFIHSQILSLSTVQSQNNLSLTLSLSFSLFLPLPPSLPPSLPPAARAPQFTLHPANITVNKGANFTLNCSAIGLPEPTIVLLDHNGFVVANFIAENIGNGVYKFSDADDSLVPGDYVCRARNDFEDALSYTATVVVRCK